MKNEKGFVYILTNPSMPGYIKIGFTNNLRSRLRSLDTTGVAMPFEPYMTVSTSKHKTLERVIHHELDKLTETRARSNREFFELDSAIAGDLLQNLARLIDDAEINDYGNTNETVKPASGKVRPTSKPTTFEMLNIPIGSELVPTRNYFPIVTTVDLKNRVSLPGGEVKTISRVLVDITNVPMNGYSYYKYQGKLLSSIRREIDKNYLPSTR